MHAHHHHGHSHHGHAHPMSHGRAFVIGIVLNLGFVAIEATYGFLADSMALLSDAGHNLSDVLGLAIAWGAALLARRSRTERFTYGLRSSSILAALFNALLLLVAVGGIAWESIRRLLEPTPVAAVTVMIVAGIGILINGFTALLFMKGSEDDLNIRGAFLHMAADAVVSLGVVIAGAVILWTGATWVDPVISLVIAGVVLWSTWDLLRQSLALSLHGVPSGISMTEVRKTLEALPGVARVHHLHVWAMSTTDTALTVHLVMPGGHPGDRFLAEAQAELKRRFGIGHATLQIEIRSAGGPRHGPECPLDPHAETHGHDDHDHSHGHHPAHAHGAGHRH
ncbi:cation diffusion facilitator family transporter [Microvirga thermotolerans]|uniref:Cation diffusion facilitator family transporter n=1 Tax=Microvirga thermotolerans TaxID=2651334 RepID=A0A5P9JYV2_9HYPH|nr:cation diffusion facilitator family transporter [Microvirga thermotolerans]QFU17439.1 cation diffusion facilitator family transporter [Microvirga thermotolerans]